jgi:hypothetical protein
MVEGTANIPTKGFLWVLAHKKGLAGWWPQGGGPVTTNGRWEVNVFYGQARDNGSSFEVVAVIVDNDTNNRLKRWVDEAPGKGYAPTLFPSSFSGCPKAQITVVKVSH